MGIAGIFSHDVAKHSAVVESCVSNKISHLVQSDLLHSMIVAAGGDPTQDTLNYTSMYSFRHKAVVNIFSKIKDSSLGWQAHG